MATKQTKLKELTMPKLTAEIQAALEKLFGAGNVLDWDLDLTTTDAKFNALERTNQKYLSTDQYALIYGEGDKELLITTFEDETIDDFETESF